MTGFDIYRDNPTDVAAHAGCSYRYIIKADHDPFALARVAQQLSFSDVAPTEFTCKRTDATCMEIIALLDNVSERSADYVYRKLLQLTCVHEVVLEARDEREVGAATTGV